MLEAYEKYDDALSTKKKSKETLVLFQQILNAGLSICKDK